MLDKTEIVLYTIEDVQEIFSVGKSSAYRLMSSDGFPSFRVGRRLYVAAEDLKNWVKRTKRNGYNV